MFKDRRVKKGWMKLRVIAEKIETHDTKTLFFVDDQDSDVSFDYFSGQYLTFRFDGLEKRPLIRSYTIASSPSFAKSIAITIKKEPKGIVSTYCCEKIKIGDTLRARGPIGRFIYDPRQDKPKLMMFAGGSGVTPFMSVLREYSSRLGQKDCPQTLSLVVSYKTIKDFIFAEELKSLMQQSCIDIRVTFTREQAQKESAFGVGRISSELIHSLTKDKYADYTYMTCGPQQMMDDIVSQLRSQAVPDKQIKVESFVN